MLSWKDELEYHHKMTAFRGIDSPNLATKIHYMDDVTYTLEFEKPLLELEKQLITLNQVSQESKVDVSSEIVAIETKIEN